MCICKVTTDMHNNNLLFFSLNLQFLSLPTKIEKKNTNLQPSSTQHYPTIKPNKNHPKPKPKSSQTKINTNPYDLLPKPTQTQTKINKNPHRLSLAVVVSSPLLPPPDFPCCHRRFPLRPPPDPLLWVNVRFEIGAVLGLEFRWNRSAVCLYRNFIEEFGIERSLREE